MDSSAEISEEEIREMNKKEFRKRFPSGWMEVSRYETLVLVLDALLETPASREFTSKEIADKAGTTKKSVDNHITSLVELGVIKKLEDGRDEVRYSLDNQSPITRKLYELNETVNLVKHGEIPTHLTEESPTREFDIDDDQTQKSRFTDPVDHQERSGSKRGYMPDKSTIGEYAH